MTFDNPFQKNAEMWQQFSTEYVENMMGQFEKNMAQSQLFQKQMQEAVSKVVNGQFELVMSSLKTMEAQMTEMMAQMKKVYQA